MIATALLGVAAVAATAAAQSSWSAYEGWEVAAVRVEGLPADLEARVPAGLALAQRSGILVRKGVAFSRRLLEADVQRVKLFLARNGFPQARIEPDLLPERGAERVDVVLRVEPGPAVRLGDITVVGLPAEAAAGADQALRALRAAPRFSDRLIEAAQADLLTELSEAGYAFPSLDAVLTRSTENVVDLRLELDPGERYTVTAVALSGAPDDLVSLTERTVAFVVGRTYSPRLLEEARTSLRTLRLHRSIRLDVEPTAPSEMTLDVQLRRRDYRHAEIGVGTWTDNPVRVSASWLHHNLFRRGRGFSVEGSYATNDQTLAATVWWNALLRVRSRAEFVVRGEIQDEESYYLRSREASVSNLFHTLGAITWRLSLTASNNDLDRRTSDEEAFRQDEGRQLILEGRWYRDTSDDPLDPVSGTRFTLMGAWAPPNFFTDSPFAMLEGVATGYAAVLVPDGALAGRCSFGWAWPVGSATDLLPNRRFFAGGYNSMRGYERRGLGPYDDAGNPIGGQIRLLASGEIRLPIKGIVGCDLFADAGQVWPEAAALDLADVEVAGGGGIMLRTPIGPIRVDVAYNFSAPLPGHDRVVVHFGIGHPF